MKRINKARKSTFNLPTLKLEGSLFLPDQLEKAALGSAQWQTEADYATPKGLKLKDDYSRAFQIACAQWKHFSAQLERTDIDATALTQTFVLELLRDAFGYSHLQPTPGLTLGERHYPVHLLAASVPVVLAPHTLALHEPDTRFAITGSGVRKKSAFMLTQELLNASPDHRWGIVSNGKTLRLLRDSATLTRPSFLEIDLADLLGGQRYAEFANVWRLFHASRSLGQPTECIWEKWRTAGQEEGTRVRDGLRQGVTEALLTLGEGFIQHPANEALRSALHSGELSKDAYFQQLLRLIYRLIFVFSVEERGLLHPQDGSPQAQTARQTYAEGYALARLRDLCLKRRARNRFDDHWQAIRIVFNSLNAGESRLALPALGGLFAPSQCPALDAASLSNAHLLTAMQKLRWANHKGVLAPVDYRNMGPEELGSVYESLLELVPEVDLPARKFGFVGLTSEGSTAGNARKLSGSYYTPDSLVQELIKSALDPVIEQRLAAQPESPIQALLAIRVIDPACGSGHFLLAAARRLAEKLAQLRANDGEQSEQDYRHALRQVVTHCIFGVDRNPMAIELARMALWLEGFEEGRPLGFLNHHLQVGDALLGLTDLSVLEQGISKDAYKALSGDDKEVCKQLAASNRQALKQLETMQKTPQFSLPLAQEDSLSSLQRIESLPQNSLQEIAAKESAYREFLEQTRTSPLRNAADMLVAAYLLPKLPHTEQQIPTTASLLLELISDADSHNAQHLAQRKAALDACQHASVFHWPLAFPQVFAQGGFDCVLGNPPWEVMQMGEEEFFATRAPEIAALQGAKRKIAIEQLETENPQLWEEFIWESQRVAAANEFVRTSGRFPLTAVGKLNTYPLFAETILQITKHPDGYAGFIVPTGIATDDSTKAYFGYIAQSERLVSLYDIENREKLFPAVDSRMKFCLITLGQAQQAEFVFFATQVSQLSDPRRRFALTAEEFNLINPNTLTCPVFRSQRDAELTKKLYCAAPVLIKEADTVGNKILMPEQNPWGITFSQGLFNMTSDSSLFKEQPTAKDDLSLYEAKLIHHFDHRFATYDADGNTRDLSDIEKQHPNLTITPRYWVSHAEVQERLCKRDRDGNITWQWDKPWLMGWRDICRATDERTVIASVIPVAGVGNQMPLMFFKDFENPQMYAAILCNLSALIFDFVARHKTGGTHMNYFIYKQLPVLPPERYSETDLAFIVPRVLELTYTSHDLSGWAQDLGCQGQPFTFNPDRRAQLRAELDAYYAKLYGLTRDELRYILDPADIMGDDYPSETFRVLKNKELRDHGEYRTQRLVLEAWDRLETGDLH